MDDAIQGIQEREDEQKRKRKFRLITPKLAEVIVSVREFFKREKQQQKQIDVSQVVERTAEAIGIGKSTVSRV